MVLVSASPLARPALIVALALGVGVLGAGCSSSPAPNSSSVATASTSAAAVSADLEAVKVTLVPGKSATIDLPTKPFEAAVGHRVLKAGTGAAITADQIVTADLMVVSGKDGKVMESTYGKKPAALNMAEQTLLPDIKTAMVGQKLGSQILVSSRVPQDQPDAGITTNDTLLFLFELEKARTPLTTAQGTAVPPKAGLPTVTIGATAKDPATFVLPAGAPPTATVAQPLIIGQGEKVAAGQRVRVSYTGVTWRDPTKPFDYSGKQPTRYAEFEVGSGRLIKAWDKNLVGQPVGSRLLLVVPPADGYGAAGNGEIKGTDTLVFVLDILDAR